VDLVPDRRCRERADLGLRVERIADLQRPHLLDEEALELGGDLLVDDEALGGDARLTVVDRPRAGPPCPPPWRGPRSA
jgi:hypothetical protein